MEVWETIKGFINFGTLILCFIGWIIWQFLRLWWFINKWILIGMIILFIFTIWLGIR